MTLGAACVILWADALALINQNSGAKMVKTLIFFFTLIFLSTASVAKTESYVPPDLEQWVDWVKDDPCPLVAPQNFRECFFVGGLKLEKRPSGVLFHVGVRVFKESMVPLPGELRAWPVNVSIDGAHVTVVNKDGRPFVVLDKGSYAIEGVLPSAVLRQGLATPKSYSVVAYYISDALSPSYFNKQHRLVFGRIQKAPPERQINEADSLTVKVYRLIDDTMPAIVETLIRLNVTGQEREVTLPSGIFVPETHPFYLKSQLSAALDKEGLHLILKPGQYQVTFNSFFDKKRDVFMRAAKGGSPYLPEVEYWAIKRNPELYTSEISIESGVFVADPNLSDIPRKWKAYPTYKVMPEGRIKISRAQVGRVQQVPTKLRVSRDVWLSFDHKSLFSRDSLTGTLPNRSTLSVAKAEGLQAVFQGESPMPIIEFDGGRYGIETKNSRANYKFLIEHDAPGHSVMAMGGNQYNHPVFSLSETLHMPPGWRLLYTDNKVSADDWVSKWNNGSLFLLALIVFAFYRLKGVYWAGFALLTFVLVYHEKTAPILPVLVLLGLVALDGRGLGNFPRLQAFIRRSAQFVFAAAVVMVIVYSFSHIRAAVHPDLGFNGGPETINADKAMVSAVSDAENFEMERASSLKAKGPYMGMALSAQRPAPIVKVESDEIRPLGRPIPQWVGKMVRIKWDPAYLNKASDSTFIFMPPLLTRMFNVLTSIFLVIVMFSFLPGKYWKGIGKWLPLSLMLLTPGSLLADGYPSSQLLNELAEKVNAPPVCMPDCSLLSKANMILGKDGVLKLEIDIDAQEKYGAPIISVSSGLNWQVISDNGSSAILSQTEGSGGVAVLIDKGKHHLVLQGQMITNEGSFAFSQPPVSYSGHSLDPLWTIKTSMESGVAKVVSFVKHRQKVKANAPRFLLPPSEMDSRFKINRSIALGNEWRAVTILRRFGGSNEPETLKIPLLSGESVQKGSVNIHRVKDQLSVTFQPGESVIRFESVLEQNDKIVVPPGLPGMESSVSLNYTDLWRVDAEGGTDVLVNRGASGSLWRTWPGESMTFYVKQTHLLDGASISIANAKVSLKPSLDRDAAFQSGKGSISAEIMTSRPHVLVLSYDPAIQFERLMLNGQSVSLQPGRDLRIPLDIGQARITGDFNLDNGARFSYVSPTILFKSGEDVLDVFNLTTSITIPHDRFVVWTRGSGIGPAILFWSLIPVIAGIAILLGSFRIGETRAIAWFFILLGLAQTSYFMGAAGGLSFAFFIVVWLLLIKRRAEMDPFQAKPFRFNLGQLALIFLTMLILLSLPGVLSGALLGSPDFMVSGYKSSRFMLSWFEDVGTQRHVVYSVPLVFYRIFVLIWALWFAGKLLAWLRLGWAAFTKGAMFRELPKREKKKVLKKNKSSLASD